MPASSGRLSAIISMGHEAELHSRHGFLEMLAGPFATAAAQLKHAESGRLNARGVACCDGFRMTAHRDGAACTGPSSESRQGTNPREMCAEGAARSAMGIWVTRKVGATD